MYGSMKKTLFAGVLAAGMMLTGCFFESASHDNNQNAVVGMRVAVPQMYTLQKSSTITLAKLVVNLISDVGDTIRDTITTSTIPALSASTAANQTIGKYYSVKPLRKWKLTAKTLDGNAVVIHDSATALSSVLLIADTVNLNLGLDAHYQMYEAHFNSLPDSLQSATEGTVKEKVNFTRLVMNISTVSVRDSSKTYFTGSPVLAYDYVATGSHVVVLSVYGNIGANVVGQLLYNDTTTIDVGPGADSTISRSLTYRGPGADGNGGTDHISVTIGKVGTITLNADTDPNAIH